MAFSSPLNIERVNALPATLTPSTMYIVKSADTTLVDIYFTNSTATELRHVLSKSDVAAMVQQSVSSLSSIHIAATIVARDALTLTSNSFVLVSDATGDATVASGAALYLWNNTTSSFSKITEYESLDIVLRWSDIQNKPTSTVADIDDAVAKKHTHGNSAQLAKIGEDANGLLTYNGEYVTAALSKAEW
jgi:hypothetical protein